ncbi:SDR family NAD(P)-dependent oxidoreductase [Sorangium sp. So ce1078]|uniref:SDR family NAD(P)-dependent oxidoreductase n=1 Tax=Sorangium sp. So ce1078 TaxID=3133329 RepID=UPI003F6120D2
MAERDDDRNELSPAKRMLVALEKMQARLHAVEGAAREPIALVGMACRFPGAASVDDFWRLLHDGVDAVREAPAARWTPEDAALLGSGPGRWGGYLDDVDAFDPGFFGISPREAVRMDPQQRLLLEVTWEALEDAGIDADRLSGSQSGVFIGVCNDDYHGLQRENPEAADVFSATGLAMSVISGRLSYTFNLQGPSIVVDTACSSSLVTLHLACQSLRARECNLAIAGGVNLILSPTSTVLMSKLQALSPDGRSKAFDASANGYVRGEGCGIVVLKRLSDALSSGDTILATLRGSAVNQDGRSTGLTAPNVLSQQALIRRALESARLSAAQVSYVEAHGTGTPLGDPIEAESLRETYGAAARPDGGACAIGSVKTNIGHLESAAGVAGLMKVVLAMRHRTIPPHLHLRQLNPRIQLDGSALVIPTQRTPWPDRGEPRRAGVSSFGISGTNAHVIVEEAPAAPAGPPLPERPELLPVSARSPEALRALAQRYAERLAGGEPLRLVDACYTASVHRTHHDHRLTVLADDRERTAERLSAFARGEQPASLWAGRKALGVRRKVVFVYPGQGAQRPGMGRQLMESEPVFRDALRAVDEALRPHLGWSVADEIAADEERSRLHLIDINQPALFAVEVALTALWRAWGIAPDAVVGHSMGEVVAAHVAGALSLEDAAAVVCTRSRLMRASGGRGATMAMVELPPEEAEEAIRALSDRVWIGGLNSPRSQVISGDPEAVRSVVAALEQRGVFCRWVKMDVPSHTPLVSPICGELAGLLGGISPRAAEIPVCSTVTGDFIEGARMDGAHWARNLGQPVLFAAATRRLLESDGGVFVEVSPHPVLLPAVEQTIASAGAEAAAVASLRRGEDERRGLLAALGALYAAGHRVAWRQVYPGEGQRVPLPSYPFQRGRFWLEAPAPGAGAGARARGGASGHPLLGERVALSAHAGACLWQAEIGPRQAPWLADHRVQGAAVLPASALLDMALSAARQAIGEAVSLEDATFNALLSFPDDEARTVQLWFSPERPGASVFRISSAPRGGAALADGAWTVHAEGTIRHGEAAGAPSAGPVDLGAILERCAERTPVEAHYEALEQMGIAYGPSFRVVEELRRTAGESLGRVRLGAELAAEAGRCSVHPALLDGCFQVLAAALEGLDPSGGVYVPVALARLSVRSRVGPVALSHVRVAGGAPPGASGAVQCDVALLDEGGALVAEARGLLCRRVEAASAPADEVGSWLHAVRWQKEPRPARAAAGPAGRRGGGRWLILADGRGVGEALAAALAERSVGCVVAEAGAAYERTGEDRYRVDPARVEDLKALLGDAFSEDAPCSGIAHLFSLDAGGALAEGPLEQAETAGCLGALRLVQAIAQRGFRDAPRLALVTSGVHVLAEPERGSPAQALLAGLAAVIGHEHPELRCAHVDLGAHPSAEEIASLAEELLLDGPEDRVALRGTARHVARLVRWRQATPATAVPAAAPRTITADGAYLITGGLGGLGLRLAAWLVEQGARHLALAGRSAPSAEAERALAQLRGLGADVRAYRADVSQAGEVARLLSAIDAELPPLRGIFHAAGVLDDGVLTQLDERRLRAVLSPKVDGAFHLHAQTLGRPLDLFVMFSSAASALGSPGQGNYAAANAFLDALAHHRRAADLHGLSVGFGPWAEVGLAAAAAARGERLAQRGVRSMQPEQALAALGRLLAEGAAHAIVAPLDLRQWREFYLTAAQSPFLSVLMQEQAGRAAPRKGDARDLLAAAEPGRRQALLTAYLREQVGRILQLEPARIELDQPFSALGLDSLTGLELRNRLESGLKLTLPATLVWAYPAVAALSTHLARKLDLSFDEAPSAGGGEDATAAAPSPPLRSQPADLDAGAPSTGAPALPPLAFEAQGEPSSEAPSPPPAAGAARATPGARSGIAAAAGQGIEPIAIVGMSCRFPGGANDPEAYWRILRDGVDAVREVPPDRWRSSADAAEHKGTRWGGFLDRVDGFDPGFFGIAPREAVAMDPQQRLLLEVAWEAIEGAGLPRSRLAGTKTGVFVGVCGNDYAMLQAEAGVEGDIYSVVGCSNSALGGRLAYLLDLRGPTLSVDTACSSSLVALHLACQSLRGRECEIALAGGVNLILSPRPSFWMSKLSALSPDGRCRTFDAGANGFVRGEGCGVVVLRRLSDALADGDPILAVIRASAVNQDGSSTGLTAPNVLSQQALIREALAAAQVPPAAVGYVEAHGTGTPLGDPIETEALRETYGEPRPSGLPCFLGSVKTNIGHLEAAAGVAGLIKAVLALRHEAIPRHLHFKALNPRISLEETPFVIPTELVPWPASAGHRYAAVSSFGISGTNAHVILEEAPAPAAGSADGEAGAHVLVLSARSDGALRELARAYCEHLASPAGAAASLGDIAYTAALRRTRHEHRLAAAGRSAQGIAAELRAFLDGEAPPDVSAGVAEVEQDKVVFIFGGQGSQWQGMGRDLLEQDAAFRDALSACDAHLRPHTGFSVLEALAADGAASRLDATEVAQPAIFAIQVALAAAWRSLGVAPAAVVGHSVGEIAAAHVAGALSLAEAARLVALRARLMQRATGKGRMAAVELSHDEAQRAIGRHADRLSIAAINGARSVVLSGDPEALDDVLGALRQRAPRGVSARDLGVQYAFHSRQMDPLAAELAEALGGVEAREAAIPLVSTVTGRAAPGRSLDAAYWASGVREPVRFAEAVETLLDDGHRLFVELGPQPSLCRYVAQALEGRAPGGAALPSMRKGRDGRTVLRSALGALHVRGYPVDWRRAHPARGRVVSLPATRWQRDRYWVDLDRAAPKALEAARRAPRSADLMYDLVWQARERGAAPAPERAGTWLLFGRRDGVGAALAALLRARGEPCWLIVPGDDDAALGDGVRSIDLRRPEHLDRVLRDAGPCRAVVHLLGADVPVLAPALADVASAQDAGVSSAVRLAQACARSGAANGARLWFVTRGAQAAGGEPCRSPLYAPLWGLGRVLALEHPELWGGLVDLDPGSPAGEVEALRRDLSGEGGEDQLAFRGAERLVARLVPAAPSPAPTPVALRADATYLVTGGLGGLGLAVARWMVDRGARHLVLLGRRGLPDRAAWPAIPRDGEAGQKIAAVEALEAAGARVQIEGADVADADRMAEVIGAIQRGPRPLRGVLHAAGVSTLAPIEALDEPALAAALRPKVIGGWVLHELTRDLDLDFTVYFSSGASVWGSARMAHYAAANSFLDALAHHRRALGLRTLSINWGPWAAEGMVTEEGQRWFARMGMGAIPLEEGLQALEELLFADVAQRTVASVDWGKFKAVYEARARRPLLEALGPAAAPAPAAPAGAAAAHVEQVRAAPPERRLALLSSWVRDEVASVLGFSSSAQVRPDQGFFDAGMDSLTAVELGRRLAARLGAQLPATIAFDYPTTQALSAHLLRDVLREGAAPAAPAERAAPSFAEPIAILGVGCRVPLASGPEAFWDLLVRGVDAVREVPAERWDVDAYYDPEPGVPGKTYTRWGGFLDRVDHFDAHFFGIAPREAASMDPQQRLLLEVTWEAVEHAGIAPPELAGSRTGVFVGIGSNEYAGIHGVGGDAAPGDAYMATGNDSSFAAGRLSYVLRLHGPTLSLNTACSSSLVAVHLACQSLRAGECDLAIAGGVNLTLSPSSTVYLAQLRALSKDGRCKTFDASADGYVRGEGCGVVVLKRLSDAQRDGDEILAVIRGSAINHDGPSSALTVPNGAAQRDVVRAALANAGVAPADVDYIEAHGTGTSLGDPIEVSALASVLGEGRTPERPLLIGSVKTNIGHLEAAAGIAGLIKVVLSQRRGVIPPHLHLSRLNPHIDPHGFPLHIPTEPTPWPARPRARIAGVSAFGLSGTNAHVVVEEVPPPEPAAPSEPVAPPEPAAPFEPGAHLLVLSAKTDGALRGLAARVGEHLAAHPELPIADVCHTARTRRAHFAHRAALVAESTAQAAERLGALARATGEAGELPPRLAAGRAGDEPPRPVFLFTGQGSQYAGMGRALYATEPVFRAALDRCGELFRGALDEPLLAVMHGDGARLDDTLYTQPALFALQIALTELWRSWGIEPWAVLGHSVGEYAAACAAGIMDLPDAVALVAARARLMQALPRDGEMVAVSAGPERVALAILPRAARASIAAINGPLDTVISGEREAVLAIVEELAAEGVKARRLAVSHAFHSPLMDPVLDALERAAEGTAFRAPSVLFASNVTGQVLGGGAALDAAYFRRHAREPVRFHDGLRALAALGASVFVEIGPHPTLSGMAMKALGDGAMTWLPSLRRGQPEEQQILASLGALYARGAAVRWAALDGGRRRRRVPLPSYAWEQTRHWLEAPRAARTAAARRAANGTATSAGALVGKRVRSPLSKAVVFEAQFSAESLPFLDEHRLYGTVVVPGSCHIARILATASEALGAGPCTLSDCVFPQPIVLADGEARVVQLVLTPEGQGRYALQIFSAGASEDDADGWVLNGTATLTVGGDAAEPPSPLPIAEIAARCPREADAALYERNWDIGFHLGPAFRWLERVSFGEGEALCRLRSPTDADDQGLHVHPGLIDSFLQALGTDLLRDQGHLEAVYVPMIVERFRFHERPSGGPLWAYSVRRSGSDAASELITGDVYVLDERGRVLIEIAGLTHKRAPREALLSVLRKEGREALYEIGWQGRALPESAPPSGRWLLFADDDGIAEALAARLREGGADPVLVEPGATFARRGDGRFSIDPQRAEDHLRLLAEAAAPAGLPLAGIVYLWALRGGAASAAPDPLSAACALSCGGALHAVQALSQSPAPARVWLVTRGARAAPLAPAPLALEQAPLWGLGVVCSQEHPDRCGAIVDLDPAAPAGDSASALLRELAAEDGERQVLIRGGQRHAARARRLRHGSSSSGRTALRPDATYLVTGGLGALGLEVARWMVEGGARHLVLVGRSAPRPEAEAAVRALRDAGATVLVLQADVSRRDDVARVLDAAARQLPPLRGVFHAAGVLDDGVLLQQDWARFVKVLAPKVDGGFLLHELTRGMELDLFVLFSSAATLLGSPGQSSYAAANAFLDALAHHRRALGLPALSINWGPWAEVGMAAPLATRLRAQGIAPFSTADALAALGRALGREEPQVAAIEVQWPRYLAQLPPGGAPLLFAELAASAGEGPAAPTEASDLRQRLEDAPPRERLPLLVERARAEAVRVLGLDAAFPLEPRQRLFEAGMDSLMALELRNRLQTLVRAALPSTLVFDYPTLEALAGHLLREVFCLEEQEEGGGDADPDEAALVQRIVDLSPDELSASLDAKLAALLETTKEA